MKVRTRFAPSPTGFMHIGNLRTALYAYLFAKHNNGDFVLRIEDTDQERLVEGAVDVIHNTLKAAGIIHDEGPDKDKGYGPYVQSMRKGIYMQYAKQLVELGGAYYCFCSKERLETLGENGGFKKYDKHCLNLSKEEVLDKLSSGMPFVIRQNVPTSGVTQYTDMVYGDIQIDCKDLEDNVLIKSDGMPTYNFANVVDDHLMEISHVIRGSEYLSSTPKYNLLYRSFGWEEPKYMHLPAIMKDAQRKLSKRYGDANFDDFIKRGYLAAAIVNYIALLGWSPKDNTEKMTLPQLIERFSVDGLNKSCSIFDEKKMAWLNGQYIKELSLEEFNQMAQPFYDKSVIAGKYPYPLITKMLNTRVEVMEEVIEKVAFIEDFKPFDNELYCNQKLKITIDMAIKALRAAIETLENVDIFDNDNLFSTLSQKCDAIGLKKGQMFWCIRIAITGYLVTPGGATEILELLGKERSLARLKESLSRIPECLA